MKTSAPEQRRRPGSRPLRVSAPNVLLLMMKATVTRASHPPVILQAERGERVSTFLLKWIYNSALLKGV